MHSDGFYVIFNCISILLRWLEPQSSPFLCKFQFESFSLVINTSPVSGSNIPAS